MGQFNLKLTLKFNKQTISKLNTSKSKGRFISHVTQGTDKDTSCAD